MNVRRRPRTRLFHQPMRGQAMAEFAVVAPIFILLVTAIFLGWLYVWRGAAVDFGLFAGAVSAGAYSGPQTDRALKPVLWDDLKGAFEFQQDPGRQAAGARIRFEQSGPGPWGLIWVERHRGTITFYFWRFYPGPNP